MVKRLLIIIFLLLTVACSEPMIVKKETTDVTTGEPELIEEDNQEMNHKFIEFSLPYEQVVINLKKVPILNEYLHSIKNKQKHIENMNLIPINLRENTVYLLEFACQNQLCSYLIFDQSKDKQAYLVADMAKHISTSFAPNKDTMILKFNRKTPLPLPLTNLVAIDLQQWKILTLKTERDGKKFLNFHWPITSLTWIDEQTLAGHIPIMTELTEENINEWRKSGSQTKDMIFYIEK